MISSICNMPGIQDWRMTPLVNVSQMFDEHIKSRNQHLMENGNNRESNNQEHPARDNGNMWKEKVSEFFSEKLNLSSQDGEWRKKIPSLNLTANHLMIDGQLVRFQGMIQVYIYMIPFNINFQLRQIRKIGGVPICILCQRCTF